MLGTLTLPCFLSDDDGALTARWTCSCMLARNVPSFSRPLSPTRGASISIRTRYEFEYRNSFAFLGSW